MRWNIGNKIYCSIKFSMSKGIQLLESMAMWMVETLNIFISDFINLSFYSINEGLVDYWSRNRNFFLKWSLLIDINANNIFCPFTKLWHLFTRKLVSWACKENNSICSNLKFSILVSPTLSFEPISLDWRSLKRKRRRLWIFQI